MPLRGGSKHLSERVELRTGIDPACWIVRRIHHHHPRAWANRGGYRFHVEVEARGHQVHRDRYACRAPDHCAVGKPARARIADLVANFDYCKQRGCDGAEATSSDGDVRRLETLPACPAERASGRFSRCLIILLVA